VVVEKMIVHAVQVVEKMIVPAVEKMIVNAVQVVQVAKKMISVQAAQVEMLMYGAFLLHYFQTAN
jgi:hypothetical protein